MENSQKKITWSLQDNKRTEQERNIFKPTGKPAKSKNITYLFWAVIIVLAISYLLPFLYEDRVEVCLTETYCFNSQDNIFLYGLYVFFNITILLLAVFGAYVVGKKIGQKFKI